MSATPDTARPQRVGECAAWIVQFLGAFAWPDRELIEAAKRAGFALKVIMDAKKKLRKAEPRLCSWHRGLSLKPVWWVWLGTIDAPPPDRPEPAKPGA